MLFFFTLIDTEGQVQESSFGEVELEVGLGLLDNIIALGNRLLNLSILEAGRLSVIPLEEGKTAYLPALKQHQNAWQQILTDPIALKVLCRQRLVVLRTRRIQRHHICIAKLEELVEKAERRLHHVLATVLGEPHRSRILHQLEAVLKRHQQTLLTEQTSLQRFLTG